MTGTQTALIVGPILTAVGIAWTAMAPSNAASAAVLTGLVTCIVGTHRFGRQGAEPASTLGAPPGDHPEAVDDTEHPVSDDL